MNQSTQALPRQRTKGLEACDTVAEGVRASLRQCVRVAKQGAEAAGIDPSRFRHWWTQGYGNPVYDAACFIVDLGEKALPLLVLFYSLALRKRFERMSNGQLINAFWQSMAAETDRESAENHAKENLACSGNLRAIRDTTREEAAEEMKLAALIDEILERGIPVTAVLLG